MSADVDAAWARLRSGLSKAYVASDIDSAIATVRPDIEAAIRAETERVRVKDVYAFEAGLAEGRAESAETLAALRDFLELRPSGHVGPERVPWFTHCGISHGENRPDCVVCAALAATPAEAYDDDAFLDDDRLIVGAATPAVSGDYGDLPPGGPIYVDAATPAEAPILTRREPLDVEVLHRAMLHHWGVTMANQMHVCVGGIGSCAEDIAAEYARLAEAEK